MKSERADKTEKNDRATKRPRLDRTGAGFFTVFQNPFTHESSIVLKKTRSHFMLEALATLPGVSEDGVKFRDYLILHRGITRFNQKMASIGSTIDNKREILLLDPGDEELRKLIQKLILRIIGKKLKNQIDIITEAMLFIREVLPPSTEKIDEKFNLLIADWLKEYADNPEKVVKTSKGTDVPIIPFSFILKNNLFYCRHYSFFTYFVFSNLSELGYLKRELSHFRDILPGGAHSWLMSGDLVIDTTCWEKPYHLETDKEQLLTRFGPEVMERMQTFADGPTLDKSTTFAFL